MRFCLALAAFSTLSLFSTYAFAAPSAPTANRALDHDSIRKFAGCYDVTFDFAETFSQQAGYKLHDPYNEEATEYVVVDEDSATRVSLQHILVFRGGVQKHWREEWVYQPTSLFHYEGNQTWQKVAVINSTGQWAQRVFSVDDSPRYECSAPWVQWNNEAYWECKTARPLPRRESGRTDYQVLNARTRQEIFADGWMIEEDNVKTAIVNGVQTPVVKEKGENHYDRLPDSRCKGGADYWTANRDTWHAIVAAWNEIYAANDVLKFTTPAGQPPLFQPLFELADRAHSAQMSPAAVTAAAHQVIAPYLVK